MADKDKLNFNLLNLIRCKYHIGTDDRNRKYVTIFADPATGVLYISQNSAYFISGHIRARARGNGCYPYNILEMIDSIFGKEDNTIEVCSGMIRKHGYTNCFTVDINSNVNPDLVGDGQTLSSIPNNSFNRWRCDPPYNVRAAREMYDTDLPSPVKLLKAGARVCRVGSFMFLLLGQAFYQPTPKGVKRIGWIGITVVPNNELRALHIFYKHADAVN